MKNSWEREKKVNKKSKSNNNKFRLIMKDHKKNILITKHQQVQLTKVVDIKKLVFSF